MDLSGARRVIEAMAGGIDPRTGEVVEPASMLEASEVIRALHTALFAIDALIRKETALSDRPARAGEAWSKTEERDLLSRIAGGGKISEIASAYERTPGSIAARLVRMGLADDHRSAFSIPPARATRALESRRDPPDPQDSPPGEHGQQPWSSMRRQEADPTSGRGRTSA